MISRVSGSISMRDETTEPSFHETCQIVDSLVAMPLANLSDSDSSSDELVSPGFLECRHGGSFADPRFSDDVQTNDSGEMILPSLASGSSDPEEGLESSSLDIQTGWCAGSNCGTWVHQRWAPLAQQGQVLLVNVA